MIIAFFGGIILGIFFFGGLYWSIQKLEKVRYPALFMTTSVMLRMIIFLIVFYFIFNGSYKNLLVAFIGFIGVRFFMIFNLKKNISYSKKQKEE